MPLMSNISRNPGDPKIVRTGRSSANSTDRLGKFLGWFSLGLGAMELFAPRTITRTLGMQGHESLIRAYGAREIASGILTLSTEKKAGLWSRVGGDAIDMVTLMTALRKDNPKRQNVSIAMAVVAGIAALDLLAAEAASIRHRQPRGNRKIYRDRSGFPKGVAAARGLAKDFAGSGGTRALKSRNARQTKEQTSLVPETAEIEGKSAPLRRAAMAGEFGH